MQIRLSILSMTTIQSLTNFFLFSLSANATAASFTALKFGTSFPANFVLSYDVHSFYLYPGTAKIL